MKSFRIDAVNHFLLVKQHLAEEAKIDDVLKITRDISGLHATDPLCAYLSLLARTKNFHKEALENELYTKKTMGKVRYARKTVYILLKEKMPGAFNALDKLLEDRFVHYLEHLDLTVSEFESLQKRILTGIKPEGMTAKEIKTELGIEDHLHPVINLMCDRGFLIRGRSPHGWRSNLHTYFRMDRYFPDVDLGSVDELQARREVVHDYLRAFGPATVKDITWWTGFKMGDTRLALEDLKRDILTIEVQGSDGQFLLLESQLSSLETVSIPKKDVICFLPLLDPYMMGYKERFRLIDARLFPYIYDRTGNATYTVLINGRVSGTWDFGRGKSQEVKVHLFETPDAGLKDRMTSEAHKIGRFLFEKDVPVRFCSFMAALTERTMGGFMTPLRDS
ncbi:winged helix DNA-binding domain-containing protein [Acidobacteriota bacterium]